MAHVYVDNVVVSENAASATVTLRLSEALASAVSVNFGTSDATAVAFGVNRDYTATNSPPVSFAPGETVKSITVPIIDDSNVEPIEWFLLTFTLPGGSPLTIDRNRVLVSLLDNDSPSAAPAVSIGDAVVDESRGFATFAVTLDRAPSATVTVAYATADLTAQAGADYTATAGTLTFTPGTRVQTVTVPITNDAVHEGFEQFLVTLSAPTGGATIADAVGTGVIGPSDAPPTANPTVRVSDAIGAEGDPYLEFVLWLDAPSTAAVTLNYLFVPGTTSVTNLVDHGTTGGSITFAPGQTTQTVRVPITDDAIAEPSETFWMTLSVPVGSTATLGRNYGFGAIVDNDRAPGTPIATVRGGAVDEAAGYATFTVTLDRPSGSTVFLPWATADLTAVAGSDYVARSGTLGFAPGETVKTVLVPLIDDAAVEGFEQFVLELGAPVGATLGVGTAVATIGASDGAESARPTLYVDELTVGEGDVFAEVTLRLDAPSADPVRVAYNFRNGTASSTDRSDFVHSATAVHFAPGQTVQTLRIPIVDDDTVERTEVFWLTVLADTDVRLSRPDIPMVIVDDDAAPTGAPIVSVRGVVVDEAVSPFARFAVTLDRPSTGVVSLQFATVDGTAIAGQDYLATSGLLTFAPGDTARTIEVPILDDGQAEAIERFSLVLDALDGLAAGVLQAVATIGASDAVAVARPTLTVQDIVVGEGDAMASFTLTLDAPAGEPVTVNHAFDNGSAVSGAGNADYVPLSGYVTFAPGATTALVSVPIVDDAAAEPAESFWITLSVSGNTNVALARSEALATIVDNDTVAGAGEPTVSVCDVVVNESDGLASFTVSLDRAATGTVSVAFATRDGSALASQDYRAWSGTVAFAPGETAKTVQVELIDDATPEIDERFELELFDPVGAVLGDRVGAALIGRSDLPAVLNPVIGGLHTAVVESDPFAQFAVTLSAPGTTPIRVSYNAQSSPGGDYVATAGVLEFQPGQTVLPVRVPISADGAVESDESFNLNLTRTGAQGTVGTSPLVGTILDDDGGARTLAYGLGDDVYVVIAATERIVELANGGVDTVRTALDGFVLPANVENLQMLGSANLTGVGNGSDNTFRGNAGDNRFEGGAGFDVVEFAVPAANYAFVFHPDGSITAQDLSGQAGTDTLVSIEGARFPDLGFLEIADVIRGRDAIDVFVDSATSRIRFTTSEPERAAWLADPTLIHLPQLQFALPLGGAFAPPGAAPVFRFHDPVGDQYFWTSDATLRDSLIAQQPQLHYEGVVAHGFASQLDALTGGGLGLDIYSVADMRGGGVGTFTLNTLDGVASLVGQPGVLGGVAFWL